mmetsp:Transcript_5873/g.18535  ORF Transcript_5873/g.18535 Transcript_5873/m.18535 type:complete len:236 (+) Transcript_5873:733-1440(+)
MTGRSSVRALTRRSSSSAFRRIMTRRAAATPSRPCRATRTTAAPSTLPTVRWWRPRPPTRASCASIPPSAPTSSWATSTSMGRSRAAAMRRSGGAWSCLGSSRAAQRRAPPPWPQPGSAWAQRRARPPQRQQACRELAAAQPPHHRMAAQAGSTCSLCGRIPVTRSSWVRCCRLRTRIQSRTLPFCVWGKPELEEIEHLRAQSGAASADGVPLRARPHKSDHNITCLPTRIQLEG